MLYSQDIHYKQHLSVEKTNPHLPNEFCEFPPNQNTTVLHLCGHILVECLSVISHIDIAC